MANLFKAPIGADFSAHAVAFVPPVVDGLAGWFYLGGTLAKTQRDRAGIADGVIMRIMDVMLALPGLVMALALTAVLGPSLVNAVIALGILSIPAYTRVARGAALSLRNRDYVDAARVLGAGDGHILLRHILPNVLPPLAVFMSFHLGGAILASSALSFIGLGEQPPTAEWGAMIGAGREFFLIAWWYVTIPGIAILLTALSTNIVGDALRDVLDPRR
jgi:peptide/nickel transport system permease protein